MYPSDLDCGRQYPSKRDVPPIPHLANAETPHRNVWYAERYHSVISKWEELDRASRGCEKERPADESGPREEEMSTALWMNIPLMVLAFGLMAGVPLWLVLRRPDWHGKQETRSVPAYLARRKAPVRAGLGRLPLTAG